MTNNVGFTFSVGDTILCFAIRARQLELVTLNIIFNVVEFEKYRLKFKTSGKLPINLEESIEYILYCEEKSKDHKK